MSKKRVYEKVYDYYIEMMQAGKLSDGARMPSLRESEKQLGVSRTSIEAAYMQLAADGYIYSVEKSGFFVTDLASKQANDKKELLDEKSFDAWNNKEKVEYDFATIGEDREIAILELWKRYIKAALRHEDRLLSYGINQGEEDLREEIAKFIRKQRNIICSPEDIIIGAGFQNLLQVLIPLLQGERTVSFPNKSFLEGATSFVDAGFTVSYRDKWAKNIYVTPAYMTKWGDVMPMKRRMELVEHAKSDNHFIIEDDYQNEFVFSNHPLPSLYAMAGGENIAYLGSFSRILLPSVRISFLILPKGYNAKYNEIKNRYNQTASKAEQIALASFLRDGQLGRHIKKMRRLYQEKRTLLEAALIKYFDKKCDIKIGESGMEMALELDIGDTAVDDIIGKIRANGVDVGFQKLGEGKLLILLSCSLIEKEKIEVGSAILGRSFFG